jgi:type IV pilus assembly protein PilM
MGFFRKKRSTAGLFVFGRSMQYVSILSEGGALKVEKCLEMPMDLAPSQSDVFGDPVALEANLLRLKGQIGGHWASSVAVALQSRDVLIRVVDFPRMGIDDARDAFQFEFDRYFPFPAQEAAFDVSEVEYPTEGPPQPGTMRMLVAATRLRPVEALMETAQRVGLRLSGVEPGALASFRAILGPGEPPEGGYITGLVSAVSSVITVGYRDNEIMVRTVNTVLARTGRGRRRSSSWAGRSTRRPPSRVPVSGMEIGRVLLSGIGVEYPPVAEGVQTMTRLPVDRIDVWERWRIERAPEARSGFETALGLALRDIP